MRLAIGQQTGEPQSCDGLVTGVAALPEETTAPVYQILLTSRAAARRPEYSS